jgi:hypothetical protein
MKKLLLFALMAITMTFNVQAQVSKNVNVTTAGSLKNLLNSSEIATVTNLTLTGYIDARDFVIVRDSMHSLTVLDMSVATIQAYSGSEGTYYSTLYPANEVPEYSFYFTSSNAPNNIKSIIIPNNATSIGVSAFAYVKSTNITIPNSVTTIGSDAFEYCTALTTLTLPNNLTSIGDYAFYMCYALQSISIPASVNIIGNLAFYGCDRLTTFTVSPSNPSYFSVNGVLYNKNQSILIQYPSNKIGTTYIVPSSVLSIAPCAFRHCASLTNVSLPNSLTYLGNRSFEYCSGLTSIDIPASVNSIGDFSFYSCTRLSTVTVPNLVTSIGRDMFGYCSGLKSINLGNSVNTIGVYALENCPSLNTITILSETPPTLDITSFSGTKTIRNVYVPSNNAVVTYKASLLWSSAFPGSIIKTLNSTPFTYSVTVPTETNACYIAGTMNNWTQQVMTKVDATHYTLIIPTATVADTYKYCSGPDWAFVEKDANGNDINNRTYSANDIVASWATIYTDTKNIHSDNTKLTAGKSFIRAELEGNANVKVYNLSGVLLKQVIGTGNITINNLKTGLYIVKVNEKAFKVVVK